MSENWIYNLDLLANNNVLNYDAAAFVKGLPPRYIGNPSMNPAPLAEMPEKPLLTQPKQDEFKKELNDDKNNEFIKNPNWKKWIFGLIIAGCAIFAATKSKSIYNWIKTKFSKPKP